jgi:nitrate reductase NapD
MSVRLRDALIEIISISEAHVAGIAAHVCQSNIERIRQTVALLRDSEIYAVSPAGKIVMTLAADQTAEIPAQLKTIDALPGVYTQALDEDIRDRAAPSCR